MNNSRPVTAIMTFRLQPGCRTPWTEEWQRVAEAARAQPACRGFRLLGNRHDDAELVVVSEWDTEAEFDTFAREAGFIWIDRSMDRVCEEPRYAVFEEVPGQTHDAERVTIRQPVSTHP